jgi:hypothetical protein
MSAILDKVRKLLRLAESPNANEAALAAAKAQELIDEHNLSAALIGLDGQSSEPDEPFEFFEQKGAPLDERRYVDQWRWILADEITRLNGCKAYVSKKQINIVGRASDAETVRYLYAYLVSEVEQLCARDGAGCGRVWRNNYRLGVVDTVRRKLNQQRTEFRQQQREIAEQSSSTALMRVNTALERIDRRAIEVSELATTRLRLRSGGGYKSDSNTDAREQGRIAGESIHLNRDGGKRLPA